MDNLYFQWNNSVCRLINLSRYEIYVCGCVKGKANPLYEKPLQLEWLKEIGNAKEFDNAQ